MKRRTRGILVGLYFVLWGLYVGWSLTFGEVDSVILGAFALIFFVGGLWELWAIRKARLEAGTGDSAPDGGA